MNEVKRRLTKKQIFAIALGIVVVVLGAHFIYRQLTFVTTDNAQVSAHITMLSSRVPGTIQKVTIEENQHVKAGELLAELDSTDYETALANAQAQLASAQARAHEADIAFKRATELFQKQAVTKERFDSAQAANREAVARLKAGGAGLKQAELNLQYTRIVAPADGVIARKSVEMGQFVPVGQAIFGFVFDGERWITANLKETELPGVATGGDVEVEVDAIPGKHFHGTVESINPSVGATFSLLPPDNATGNFTKVVQRVPVRIKLVDLKPGDAERLQAGLSAEVSIRKQ